MLRASMRRAIAAVTGIWMLATAAHMEAQTMRLGEVLTMGSAKGADRQPFKYYI